MAALTRTVSPAPTLARGFVRGFTLTEMAVVLVIASLLIGGMIVPLSAQQDMRYVADTQKQFADISDALYGFAASKTKPYLPCPDTNADGLEDRTGSTCTGSVQEGGLPWATLGLGGLGRQDAWGNPFRYRVAATFSDSSGGFTLSSLGDLRVCEASACSTPLATALPAVFLSSGKNGAATTTDADELENLDGDNDFVQRSLNGSYDDLVVWLPTNILINRMISSGRLP